MPNKKPRSAKQLANDERLRQMARERVASTQAEGNDQHADTIEVAAAPETVADEQGFDELKKQMQEVLETNALLKAALLGKETAPMTDKMGESLEEFERYSLDPKDYPDPTTRLAAEARLIAVNFLYNYELDYTVGRSRYQTATGRWTIEPKFQIQLNRIKLDDEGAQTNKRYMLRRLIFHEDPDAAIVVAHENGIDVDKQNHKQFLDEMRYIRCRDWLFDIFWPKPAQAQEQITEEVIGGTIVQVFTKNSEEASEIDFSKLNTKLR